MNFDETHGKMFYYGGIPNAFFQHIGYSVLSTARKQIWRPIRDQARDHIVFHISSYTRRRSKWDLVI